MVSTTHPADEECVPIDIRSEHEKVEEMVCYVSLLQSSLLLAHDRLAQISLPSKGPLKGHLKVHSKSVNLFSGNRYSKPQVQS